MDKFGIGEQNEAGQRLIEFCQESTPVIANTLFQKHSVYTWTLPGGQYQNQIDYSLQTNTENFYTVSKKKKKKTPGADCGSDHELLIAKFRLKLKKK